MTQILTPTTTPVKEKPQQEKSPVAAPSTPMSSVTPVKGKHQDEAPVSVPSMPTSSVTPVKQKLRHVKAPESASSMLTSSPLSSHAPSTTGSASQKGTYKVGDLVCTKVFMSDSNKKYKKYLSIVQKIDKEYFSVMFLSSTRQNNTVFTINEDDTSLVTVEEIECIITEAYTMNHRGQYVFSKAINLL